MKLGGAIALALLGAGWGAHAMAGNPVEAASIQTVAAGEAALRKEPRDAQIRAALGRAYLRAGRFESAVAVLGDAVVLGDASPRTTLSLALAQIALGHGREALALLQTVQGALPPADYGLALALAGDTNRGVSVLAEAARAGDANEKLRQNLAYAYALDGRWAEARNVAAMDLSPDKLDERLTQWAATARPDGTRARVAGLLGAPVVSDSGLPTALALRDDVTPAQLAARAPVAQPVAAPVVAPAPEKELPALAAHEAAPTPAPAAVVATPLAVSVPVVEPVREAAPEPAPAPEQPSRRAVGGVMAWSEVPANPAPVARSVSRPVVQHVAYEAPAPKARPVKMRVAKAKVEAAPRSATGSHLVQLGAFSNEANAEKARKMAMARSDMRAHEVTITKATVNGREFWRVAALGFDSGSAQGACGRVKKSGGVCMAMSGKSVSANGPALALANAPAAPGHKR